MCNPRDTSNHRDVTRSPSVKNNGEVTSMELLEPGFAATLDSMPYSSLKRWALRMNHVVLQKESELNMLRKEFVAIKTELYRRAGMTKQGQEDQSDVITEASTEDGFLSDLPTGRRSINSGELQKLINQPLEDLYGDKGNYTGTVLKSTEVPHGTGKIVYAGNKRMYEGEWKNGRWNGRGKAIFANGDSYEGQYESDKRHGHGKYTWADGRVYEGHFKADHRHGQGMFTWPDGSVYVSPFLAWL